MPIEVESPEEMGYSSIRYNLAESSVRDIRFGDLSIDLNNLVLCYGEHRGDSALREAIVREETGLDKTHVLVCPSAATALFIISTALLNAGDHLIVLRPNYATNIETPKAIGCSITYIDVVFEQQFQPDWQQILDAIQPNTKLISLTTPHNPTGIILEGAEVQKIIRAAEEKGIFVLTDETYRYLDFQQPRCPYYAAFSDHVISVASLSKAHGAPGIRTGWIICKNELLMEQMLAAKEQIIIANSVVDEAIALHLLNDTSRLTETHEHIRNNFAILQSWMAAQEYLEWVAPSAGVVGFPRIKAAYNVDTDKFYRLLYEVYGTMTGAGHWFEQSDRYMRIGFGYPTQEELKQGLENITTALRQSLS